MDQHEQSAPRQPNPRRRKRDPKRVFMESYLPVIIGAGVLILIVLIIILASTGSSRRAEKDRAESEAAAASSRAEAEADRAEADRVIAEAKALANSYDFEGAIAVLDAFGTRIYEYDDMLLLRDSYEKNLANLVSHTGKDVVHLSVQILIADADRAFASKEYGAGFKKNFITTDEFRSLLDQLYARGYVLVDMEDLVETRTDESGNTFFTEKTLLLPPGKKPLMLTQTQVNYYTYMVDPNQDKIPDKNGFGFASRLILQNGELTNEMVDRDGNTVTGSYDVVPILEEFINTNPDFSYHGARAILAVTGYNGIFGYRDDTLTQVTPVLDALRERGYKIAYYTYYNTNYSTASANKITDEAGRWARNIELVLGKTDYMVYALSGDIAKPETAYSGEKFQALQEMGMHYYLGFCTKGEPWFMVETSYVRMGRILANAENLSTHPEWFDGICDPASVLVESR